jgi:hypothetical protein
MTLITKCDTVSGGGKQAATATKGQPDEDDHRGAGFFAAAAMPIAASPPARANPDPCAGEGGVLLQECRHDQGLAPAPQGMTADQIKECCLSGDCVSGGMIPRTTKPLAAIL